MNWAGIILAAGQGTRMKSQLPKPLHSVCGQAMLWHVARAMRRGGIEELTLVVAPAHEQDTRFASSLGEPGTLVVQAEPDGTAGAVLAAERAVQNANRVIVGYADTPLIRSESISRLRDTLLGTDATVVVLTSPEPPTPGLGRVKRDNAGGVQAIVEERDADAETRRIREVNTGWYAIDAEWLWGALKEIQPAVSGERYLTEIVRIAVETGRRVESVAVANPEEATGVNDRIQLAAAERSMRARIRRRWMSEGVTLVDPDTVYIDAEVHFEQDVTVYPNTHLRGRCRIGRWSEIGPNAILADTVVGERSQIVASHCEDAVVEDGVSVGPFSRLRPGARLENDVHVGNYAEIKNSIVGSHSRIGHFSYVGDSTLGQRVNIGAGTVTANFDGTQKHATVIGDDCFVGSGSMLIAPVTLGARARTGAGSVVTRDVAPNVTVKGVPARAPGDVRGQHEEPDCTAVPARTEWNREDRHRLVEGDE